MDIIANWGTVFMVMAIIFGFYMTWGIGANDVANAMGTSVGSGAIKIRNSGELSLSLGSSSDNLFGGPIEIPAQPEEEREDDES